jgi:hypothetical protein
MIERRRTVRLYEPISLRVWGEAGDGNRFEFETVARDISGGGLCATASRLISAGERISIQIQFARAGTRPFHAPTVTTRGLVLRVQEISVGTFLFAAAFALRGVI